MSPRENPRTRAARTQYFEILDHDPETEAILKEAARLTAERRRGR